jgi:plasmid stability protein
MADVRIRDLDEKVHAKLKVLAVISTPKGENTSVERYLKRILFLHVSRADLATKAKRKKENR